MAEETPLTLVSLKFAEENYRKGVGQLDETSPVNCGDGSRPTLKEYVETHSITQKVEKKIEGDEQTREDALNTLLERLRSDSASNAERGSLFLVQHTKEGARSNDYDIYVLMGNSTDNYKLQRIGTSIEYGGGGSTTITAGKGIEVKNTDVDTYEISLDEHMSKIRDYVELAELN